MKIHPDVIAAHAQFGGDLLAMQKCYEWKDLKDEVANLKKVLALVKDHSELEDELLDIVNDALQD